MPYIHSYRETEIRFKDPSNEEKTISLRVRNDQDEILGLVNIASEKRVSKVQRIKFIRLILVPVDGNFNTIGLHDALRFVEHCELLP